MDSLGIQNSSRVFIKKDQETSDSTQDKFVFDCIGIIYENKIQKHLLQLIASALKEVIDNTKSEDIYFGFSQRIGRDLLLRNFDSFNEQFKKLGTEALFPSSCFKIEKNDLFLRRLRQFLVDFISRVGLLYTFIQDNIFSNEINITIDDTKLVIYRVDNILMMKIIANDNLLMETRIHSLNSLTFTIYVINIIYLAESA